MIRQIMMAAALLAAYAAPAAEVRQELHEGWRFRQARFENWHEARVPGVVQTDLIRNGLLDDPFLRLDERSAQWVDKEDWVYQTSFDLSAEMAAQEHVRLRFYGLDTYADVYLNDEKILSADNMFREWTAEVKPLLRDTGNTLRIYFHSPIKVALPLWEADPLRYLASNDQAANGGMIDRKVSVFTRKAGYHYGWDWGPRLVTSGIWRPVVLEGWSDARMGDVRFVQSNVTARKADVRVVARVTADKAMPDAVLRITDQATGAVVGEKRVALVAGENAPEVCFSLRNPKLWWCSGQGEAHLYRFRTELLSDGKPVASRSERIGIRSIEVVREADAEGVCFYFKINGRRIFAKGANWIPGDSFLPEMTRERYARSLQDAVDTNMNMLRVWGGGIYEDDAFYELCDELGILVWQDFMFACSVYPAEEAFLESVRREAEDNIRRLRNHACLAIWCGNNEIRDALANWGAGGGWLGMYGRQNPENAGRIWRQYTDLFEKLLPEVVAAENDEIYYLPSSPTSDSTGLRKENIGDFHYWTTWQQGLPISTFADIRSRFFSEYGFQSFPEYASVKSYATQARDEDISSEVMLWHQRAGAKANATIARVMNLEYGEAKDFRSFLYLSQLLQADAMRIAVEAHRRDMPYCMGSLYWQHNDCWPVASWSGCDYYGRRKMVHYALGRAFDEVLVSPFIKNDTLRVQVVSDRPEALRGVLMLRALTTSGEEVAQLRVPVRVQGGESKLCLTEPLRNLLGSSAPENTVFAAELREQDGQVWREILPACGAATLTLPRNAVTHEIAPCENGYEVTLRASGYAKGVFLTVDGEVCDFSDNAFDLLAGESRRVQVRTTLGPEAFATGLRVLNLADARR